MTRLAKSSSVRDASAWPIPPKLICIEGSNSPKTSRWYGAARRLPRRADQRLAVAQHRLDGRPAIDSTILP